MPEEQPLVPVFVPPLASFLAMAERKKGSALTAEEVVSIRDKSPCIMMQAADAAAMSEKRGFVDVNPKNCWADWHRLRVQMVGGYLPKIILCLPGGNDLRAKCEPILRAEGIEHEFRPHDDSLLRAFKIGSMTSPAFTPADFAAIEAHTAILFALSEDFTAATAPQISRKFLALGRRLLGAGGIAIKCESSGVSHPASRWARFTDHADRSDLHKWNALFHACVLQPIGNERTDLYTCGMHALGAADLIVSPAVLQLAGNIGSPTSAATELFRTFAVYLLAECKPGQFTSGHTFSSSRDAPRYRVVWEPCTGYAPDSFFFNPFGRWRFMLP
jgi:hypothetical protein